jgi:pantoate--beta-alanine ligase
VREPDGLAMSSRNAYLSPEHRRQALVLYRSLMRVKKLVDEGESTAAELIAVAKNEIATEPAARLDYFEIVNPDTLDPVEDVSRGALAAVAAFFGTTRLIDNVVLFGSNG